MGGVMLASMWYLLASQHSTKRIAPWLHENSLASNPVAAVSALRSERIKLRARCAIFFQAIHI